MKEQLASLGVTVLQALAPLVVILIGLLTKKLHDLITVRVKNEKVRGILDRLVNTAYTVVTEVEQTTVSKLDPNNPGEGFANAKAAAVANLKTHMGAKGLEEAKKILGIDDASLDQVISSYIESQVHNVKISKPAILGIAEPLKIGDSK